MRISDWSSDVCSSDLLGVTRRVPDNTPMVTFEHGQYSVPSTLLGQSVWIRHHGGTDEIVICALDDGGPTEVARARKSVVEGKGVSVRVDLGGRRILKKKKHNSTQEK